jgi:DNA polymerase-3 subunit delta
MILTLIGDDLFSKEQRINVFLEKVLGERKNDPLARKFLFATDTSIPSIADAVMEACDSVSMFASEQVVVVRKGEALKTHDMEVLTQWLSTKPNCKLLLEFEKLAARATKKDNGESGKSSGDLYKALKAAGEIEKYDSPREWDIPKWITNHVQTNLGKRIEPMAVQYIADALGTDLSIIDGELRKIILFAPESKEISLEQAKLMIVPQREIASFEIRESFGNREARAFTQKLRELLDSNVDGVSIISALQSYAVRLLHINSMLDSGMHPKEIAAKLGVNEWLFCTKQNEPRKARNWNKSILCRIIKRLGELDYEIKTGKCDGRMSLELSLASLVIR